MTHILFQMDISGFRMQAIGQDQVSPITRSQHLHRFLRSIHNAQSADHQFLGSDTGHDAHSHPPVESQGLKHRLHGLSYISYERVLLLLLHRIVGIVVREISQEPYHHREDQDHSAHLLEILLSLLPGVSEYGLCSRNTIRREFHHEREVVILEEAAHYPRRHDGKQDSQGI